MLIPPIKTFKRQNPGQKVKIPQDWDGETWFCLQLEWPASRDWIAVLSGLLTSPLQGRFWDERTGTVTDAQDVGWQIWSRNVPFTECDGETPCPECEECSECPQCGGLVVEDSESMGQVVTDITLEGNLLYKWFGPCCKILVGELCDVAVDDEPWDPIEEEPEYSSCSKAWAVIRAIYKCIEAFFTAESHYAWEWVGEVEQAVGYDLDNQYILTGVSRAKVLALLGQDYSDFFDYVDQAQLACALDALFDDDPLGIATESLYEAVKGVFRAQFASGTWWGVVESALDAFGREDLDTVARVGALNDGSTCTCGVEFDPDATEPDPVTGWYLSEDKSPEVQYVLSDAGTVVAAVWTGLPDADAYGVFWRIDVPPISGDVKRMSQTDWQGIRADFVLQDKGVNDNTSDKQDEWNQTYPFIQISSEAVATIVAAQRGFSQFTRLTTGVDSSVAPEWLVAQTGAWILYNSDETFPPGWVVELRYLHKAAV